jgi:hypothetical protein
VHISGPNWSIRRFLLFILLYPPQGVPQVPLSSTPLPSREKSWPLELKPTFRFESRALPFGSSCSRHRIPEGSRGLLELEGGGGCHTLISFKNLAAPPFVSPTSQPDCKLLFRLIQHLSIGYPVRILHEAVVLTPLEVKGVVRPLPPPLPPNFRRDTSSILFGYIIARCLFNIIPIPGLLCNHPGT